MNLNLFPIEPVAVFFCKDHSAMKALELISSFERQSFHRLIYLLAMGDESVRGIVGGHAYSDSVPHDDTDLKTLHFTTEAGAHMDTIF
jgi:hypothetical protein